MEYEIINYQLIIVDSAIQLVHHNMNANEFKDTINMQYQKDKIVLKLLGKQWNVSAKCWSFTNFSNMDEMNIISWLDEVFEK